jgi:hypothetical protein
VTPDRPGPVPGEVQPDLPQCGAPPGRARYGRVFVILDHADMLGGFMQMSAARARRQPQRLPGRPGCTWLTGRYSLHWPLWAYPANPDPGQLEARRSGTAVRAGETVRPLARNTGHASALH